MVKPGGPLVLTVVRLGAMCIKQRERCFDLSEFPKRIVKLASSSELPVTLRIGKEGLGDNIVSELDSQLNKNKIVKVKLNRNIYDRKARDECWVELSSLTKSRLVMKKGNVAVFYRA